MLSLGVCLCVSCFLVLVTWLWILLIVFDHAHDPPFTVLRMPSLFFFSVQDTLSILLDNHISVGIVFFDVSQ